MADDARGQAATPAAPGAGTGGGDAVRGDTPDLSLVLLVSVFVVATCGLVYELLAGTIATYLLGDSVTQFSTVIGTYLFAMGIGSWFSRYVKRDHLRWFVRVEVMIALIGGASGAMLFLLFPLVDDFRPILYGLVLLIGFLVGLEIPLLINILKGRYSFGDLVSNVLTYDYIGALAASLLFPLLIVPFVGLIRGGFIVGLANILVALLLVFRLRRDPFLAAERVAAVLVTLILFAGAIFSEKLQSFSEGQLYDDPVVYAVSSPYQRIALTRRHEDLRLYLDGNLQFSARDEYRYHEALVWPALGRVQRPSRVLILGGGDGLALREVLKHDGVREAVLVDLDPAITKLFSSAPALAAINQAAFDDPRVTTINADAFTWVRDEPSRFDVVIIDLPDPTNHSIGKLYSRTFYRGIARLLAPGGVASVQSGSAYVTPQSFAMVGATLEAAGLPVRPFHVYVPSFGEWGFHLAGAPAAIHRKLLFIPDDLRFLTEEGEARLYDFAPDMRAEPPGINRLDNQALVRLFTREWRRYGE
ncbi:polyamine aminopropyltransferase [Sphingomicrobium arenosum]|uniref:polyamine aminopropyltransferase n=1 Tax=Sphingomicrobium arenosum TaxID=2233861 RepID=UPI00223EFD06|nr:polyamine aminopropyltransferase [Sphingomicrobium arenosum]